MIVAEQKRETPIELLEAVELPILGAYIWEWWIELNGTRGSSGFGPLPISYTEIAAWSSLMKIIPEPWEVAVLKAIDRLYVNRKEK